MDEWLHYFRPLPGRCVNVDAAALLALAELAGLRSTLAAALAAALPVVSLRLPTPTRCVRAEAAALFSAFDARGFANVFPAADAASLPVVSRFGVFAMPSSRSKQEHGEPPFGFKSPPNYPREHGGLMGIALTPPDTDRVKALPADADARG